MITPAGTAAIFALFVWWFSTGAVLYVVRRADRIGGDAYRMAVLTALPVLALGIAGLFSTRFDDSIKGAYTGFLSALAIWGWIELTFLTGLITGPSREACPSGARGRDRLWRAWNTLAHHELLLVCGLLLMIVASGEGENKVAFWTYLLLFVARISAKLNLFFGVPRINTEFVPDPLTHLKSYFRRGPVTLAFPIAIGLLTLAVGCLYRQLTLAETSAETVQYALLTALAALALLEHWLMVLPLPDARLWRWILPARVPDKPTYPPVSINSSER